MQTTSSHTLIVGLGKTGLSCARFLAAQGETCVVTDSRQQPPGLEELISAYPDIPVHTGGFRGEDFESAEKIVLSPGVALREPLVAAAANRGTEVLGDIELFARNVTAPVIAITGTNGKSTVTTLVAEMAEKAGRVVQAGGNLGMPALELLGNENTDLYVLELSSFQLETTDNLNAAAAVVLNVTADHMDRYESLEEYCQTKAKVYAGDGVMIINKDDPYVTAMADSSDGSRKVIRFGLGKPVGGEFGLVTSDSQQWLAFGDEKLLPVNALKIPGRHNQSNALAALALGYAIGLDMDAMLSTLVEFTGLAHRSEWVAEHNGVRWFNDSKATNVGATIAALEGMPGPLILIAGGDGKGADFSELKAVMNDAIKAVILVGRDANSIRSAIEGSVTIHDASSMHDAVRIADSLSESGDSVLLSPACASFDMYGSYIERGEDYVSEVRGMCNG